MREEQLALATLGSPSTSARYTSGSAPNLAATAASAAGVWVASPGRATNASQQPLTAPQRFVERAKHIAREVPKRTQQVLSGNDELVESTMAHGTPKGLAVFMALLMLHVPSVALGSLVAGVFLIRGHRPKAGSLFLGLAAILGLVIFSLLPW